MQGDLGFAFGFYHYILLISSDNDSFEDFGGCLNFIRQKFKQLLKIVVTLRK